jgi:hypothetical protein
MKFWKVKTLTLLALVLFACGARANVVVTPWVPIFKGIDRAVGTNFPSTTYTNNGIVYTDSTLQVVNCVRVDLSDPDVQFFTTPPATNYVPESSETYSISVSNLIKRHGLQVATVANFSEPSLGYDSPIEGSATKVYGLQICTGRVVSVTDFGPDANNRYASLLFTTNKTPYLALSNAPPGTNTAGIYTAVSGYYAVLTNGVIIGNSALTAVYPDPTFHQLQPRTLFGLSADRRYFYMIVIDGRQPSYSNGANDNDMGFWLLAFGASDGLAMDGGGSAAMYMENCGGGNPLPLGHSSFINTLPPPGRERILGSHLGVYAAPLSAFVNNVVGVSGSTAATITWTTISNSTTQVEYGTTPSLGTFSAFNAALTTNHAVMLSGLASGRQYYYRVLSAAAGVTNTATCAGLSSFVTTNFAGGALMPLTQNWKWQTANLDGVNWQAVGYNDSSWSNGPACLWADNRNPVPSAYTNLVPNFGTGTRMPIESTGYPFSTYYFRASFTYSNILEGLTLTFSNFLDDGAVFYLNGFEIFRTNMPLGSIDNATATPVNCPCTSPGFNNSATCPMIFSLTGSSLSNFVVGTNTYAVELHNYRPGNPSADVAFESAVHFALPPPVVPPPFITNVVFVPGETSAALTWTTLSNSTSQVLYGVTPTFGSSNALDSNLVSNHAMVLTGLKPHTEYFFRILSSVGTNQNTYDGTFTTTSFFLPLVTFSNLWRFQTADLTGTNWTAPNYNDSGWPGQGAALLCIEGNLSVTPRTTPLPSNGGALFPTYYFRTHFNFSAETAGFALFFTNFIDDGAVLYLNGREVQRVRLNPGPVGYSTIANGCPLDLCDATPDVPDVFRLSGDALTNLVFGDNVLAAEVHQFAPNESDIVFGSAVALVRALVSEVPLRINHSNNIVCVSWDGLGFTLQRANTLTGAWSDVPGPITSSPYCTTNPATTTFFRLRE